MLQSILNALRRVLSAFTRSRPNSPAAFHHFLSLPVELREIIYEYHCLHAADCLHAASPPPRPQQQQLTEHVHNLHPSSHRRRRSTSSLHFLPDYALFKLSTLSILQTNGQIRDECLDVLASKFCFKLSEPRVINWHSKKFQQKRNRNMNDKILWPDIGFRTDLHWRVQFLYLEAHYIEKEPERPAATAPYNACVQWPCWASFPSQVKLYPALRALVVWGSERFNNRGRAGCTRRSVPFEGYWERPEVVRVLGQIEQALYARWTTRDVSCC
ncbi:MAG: hypothetical protein M1831_003742 [Alyxoria varia]|nr:MAG: hypothetical protein M1831_003742 [Alyxoria varia]